MEFFTQKTKRYIINQLIKSSLSAREYNIRSGVQERVDAKRVVFGKISCKMKVLLSKQRVEKSALSQELVLRERLLEIVHPCRQVGICVSFDVLVDVG